MKVINWVQFVDKVVDVPVGVHVVMLKIVEVSTVAVHRGCAAVLGQGC